MEKDWEEGMNVEREEMCGGEENNENDGEEKEAEGDGDFRLEYDENFSEEEGNGKELGERKAEGETIEGEENEGPVVSKDRPPLGLGRKEKGESLIKGLGWKLSLESSLEAEF
ncbi:hypothetical protein E2C01_027388 [Portunus trituberculatus]|uniref:Uncharacterized protein n=1 Tax=Portunus trituberculatus TaxID=210409 RepID=A0A5B7ELF2_PORTR|nr:hypothetical protein [Portunus trituberculatus]